MPTPYLWLTLFSTSARGFVITALAAGIFVAICTSKVLAADDQEQDSRIDELITQLGDDSFETRQKAEILLVKAGPFAIAQLKRAQFADDIEVRFAASRIELVIEQQLTKRQIAAFIASDPAKNQTLPGWNRFSAVVGGEAIERNLFANMYLRFPDVFHRLESPASELDAEYNLAIKDFLQQRYLSVRIAEPMAITLFVGLELIDRMQNTDPSERNEEFAAELTRINTVLLTPKTISLVRTSEYIPQIKRLLGQWVQAMPRDSLHHAESMVHLISNYHLKDQTSLLLELAGDDARPIRLRADALRVVGEFGSRAAVFELQKFLDEGTVVAKMGSTNEGETKYSIELRDVALASCVHLAGQKISEFGFVSRQDADPDSSLSSAGFVLEQQRQQALNKWQRFFQESMTKRE